MTGLARSLVILLIAIFVAGTLAVSAATPNAHQPVMTAAMPMTTSESDCKTCDPHMDMTAGCDLVCALSVAPVLLGPVTYTASPSNCRFDLAEVSETGLAPPPAFIPPRTIILA